jgi:hypothetical protein
MLYREIIAVCSQIHTKHINTLCGQNVELLNVKLTVYKVTTAVEGFIMRKNSSTKVKDVFKLSTLISFLSSAFVGGKTFASMTNELRLKCSHKRDGQYACFCQKI